MKLDDLTHGILLALLLLVSPASRARGNVVEVRLVHGYEISGRSRVADECHECETIRIEDPFGRAEAVLVSKEPDLRVASGATRAILAYEVDTGRRPKMSPSGTMFRVVLVVDSGTRIALAKLRAGPEFEYALTSVNGKHRSLGELHTWSAWELDVGFFRNRDEISSVFSVGWPPVHVVHLTEPPLANDLSVQDSAGSEPCTEAAPCPRDRSLPDAGGLWVRGPAVWAQGPMRGGAKHGVWTFHDYRGEVVRLEVLQDGRPLETIEPWEHPDSRRLRELMKEP